VRLSANGRALLQGFEGLALTAYWDVKGYSIGYGHFGATKGQVITRAEADLLFDGDVAASEAIVSFTTPIALAHQFDAMVSLAYNEGSAAFSGSTLARKHNAGDFAGATAEFARWNLSGGAVNPVLVARRAKEAGVYAHGYQPFGGYSPEPAPAPTPQRLSLLVVSAAVGLLALLLRGRR
jgi:lysozyme